MTVSAAFIIYLILFRLSIIIAGIVSIILGYRLFCRGIGCEKSSGQGAELNAKVGGYEFSLKNAAPGIFFVLFGVVIISIMFSAGGPEMTLKTLRKYTRNEQEAGNVSRAGEVAQELTMKGNNQDALGDLTKRGLYYEEKKDIAKAIENYEKALSVMAAPMNNLAWLYLEQGRTDEALPISQMAVQLAPKNPGYLDTYATALYKSGNNKKAAEIMEKAAAFDTQYLSKLNQYRQAIKN